MCRQPAKKGTIYWPFLPLEMLTIFFRNVTVKTASFPDVTFHSFGRNSYLKNFYRLHHGDIFFCASLIHGISFPRKDSSSFHGIDFPLHRWFAS